MAEKLFHFFCLPHRVFEFFPFPQNVLRSKTSLKKVDHAFFLERCPVAADDAIMRNDGLEDAAVVVGTMLIVYRKHNVAALVAYKVFVIRGDEEKFAFFEAPGAAFVGKVALFVWQRWCAHRLYMEVIAQ